VCCVLLKQMVNRYNSQMQTIAAKMFQRGMQGSSCNYTLHWPSTDFSQAAQQAALLQLMCLCRVVASVHSS